MRRYRTLFAAAGALLVAGACDDSPIEPFPDPDAPIQTEAAVYTLVASGGEEKARVEYEFTNLSERPISFPNCNGGIQVVVERETDEGWTYAYSSGYPDCLSPPVEVAPGASTSGAVQVVHYPPTSSFCCGFEPGTEPPGTYRIRVTSAVHEYHGSGPPWGEPVEERYLVSNRFRIER